ncbi:MAG TPA: malectin [Candidatus Acidoferrum sp.]|nr:malectin [Candidatus Acidoferrum sp.]
MRKLFFLTAFLAVLCFPKGVLGQQPIRVNCGGPGYTDSKGQVWQADYDFNGGMLNPRTATITGTADPTLYQTGRKNDVSVPTTKYNFPVANGNYHVNLYFAETYALDFKPGARVFNVKIQGNVAIPNLDVFAEAGANAALIKGVDVTVTNGALNLEFDNVVDNAKVNAIEILPGSSGPSLLLNFKYPDGTPVVGTLAYTVTSSLVSFQGNAPLNNGQAQCVIFANPSAMGLSALFQVALSLTDTAGHVLWQLSVGMNPAQVNIAAVQSSALNVVVQKL